MEDIIYKAFLSAGELAEAERIIAKDGRYTEKELDFMLSIASRTTRMPVSPKPTGIETHIRRNEFGEFSLVSTEFNNHLNN